MKGLLALYKKTYGEEAVIEPIATGAGSNRRYYRMGTAERTVIGVVGESAEENGAFVYLARHFREKDLPVPEVYAVSEDGMRYLQEDLGKRLLYDHRGEEELLVRVVRTLPRLQIVGGEGLDYTKCYPSRSMDRESIFFDLNYFKYCFVKPLGIAVNEVRLEEAFRNLASDLEGERLRGFMYRDFQARNVMLTSDDEPRFIDFQGGREGPVYYDVASFLWQASAGYSEEQRRRLIGEYYDALREYVSVPSREEFEERLRVFVLFRILQVLGAYGFRGYFERKAYFVRSMEPAIENLRKLLEESDFGYTYLIDVLREIVALPRFSVNANDSGPLVARVYSFAYKYGIPEDESGNGGGYVFDCRGSHNPGRYPEYGGMTGLDREVIDFIERDGELPRWLERVYELVDGHVERYMERGFTSIMFSFGCTGGRHRSVYAAEHLAEHLRGKFGIEVRVCHREHNINKVLK